jgi:hypothetical protein
MLNVHEHADGIILMVRMSGKLTKEDYMQLLSEVERLVKKHGTIRILCQLDEFHGWNLGALWEDIKCDARHFADIERLALVGDFKWQVGMAIFCSPFGRAKSVRYFDRNESDRAKAWIYDELLIVAPPS